MSRKPYYTKIHAGVEKNVTHFVQKKDLRSIRKYSSRVGLCRMKRDLNISLNKSFTSQTLYLLIHSVRQHPWLLDQLRNQD